MRNQIERLVANYPIEYKSCGTRYPNKTFYVIRQHSPNGRGMFSLLGSVISHLHFADSEGLVPVIDFESYQTVYNESRMINGTMNAWEYYFEPVSEFSLDEVYTSRNVLLSNSEFPRGYSWAICDDPSLFEVYRKYIRIKALFEAECERFVQDNFLEGEVLGVHFRGQEQRTAPGHPFPATKSQICTEIRNLLDEFGFQKIFLVTEEASYIRCLRKTFKETVICRNHYRTTNRNAYLEYPRENHKYQLGRDILIDASILARCHGLLCVGSNVSDFARLANNHKYVVDVEIQNGFNSSNRFLARRLWFIKKALPDFLGGFQKRPPRRRQTGERTQN